MIEVEGLTKRFGSILAVDDLSFTVNAGEVLGFLGPNGAGKSTTMKMLTGFLRPDEGTAKISGFDILERPIEAKRSLGYLPEGAPGYGDMSVLGFLQFIAEIRGLDASTTKTRIDEVIAEVHLDSVLTQKIETLSKGFRRRVGLAQAILHDPQVLILDEPTDGLDPNQKYEVRKLIEGMAKDKIIIVSTHILEEVEAVCTRAMIIAQGRLLVDGTPDELAARSKYHGAIALQMPGIAQHQGALAALAGVDATENSAENEITLLPKAGANLLVSVNDLVRKNNWPVDVLYQKRGRLDEVFRDITGEAAS